MKAAVLEGREKLEVRDVPDPVAGSGDVIISPSYVGVCGTDLHFYKGEYEHRRAYPHVLGHEIVGVLESDSEALSRRGIAKGSPVVIDPVMYCGSCDVCAMGRSNVCRDVKVLGLDVDGGLCEKVAVPASAVYPLPESIRPEEGVMLELYSIAVHCLTRARINPRDMVVLMRVCT